MDASILISRVMQALSRSDATAGEARNAALATIDALISDIDEQSIGNMRAHLISRRAQVADAAIITMGD